MIPQCKCTVDGCKKPTANTPCTSRPTHPPALPPPTLSLTPPPHHQALFRAVVQKSFQVDGVDQSPFFDSFSSHLLTTTMMSSYAPWSQHQVGTLDSQNESSFVRITSSTHCATSAARSILSLMSQVKKWSLILVVQI